MAEIRDCPRCGAFFNYNGLREVCASCAQKEEKLYEEVYRFLRRRENRAATVEQISEQTGVTEDMLYDWVRRGRLQPAMFPNLGYPCDRCGAITQSGKLCERCTDEIERDLEQMEAAEELRHAFHHDERATYHGRKR